MTGKFHFDAGNAAMDSDHQALVTLLDDLEHVCRNPEADTGRCDTCPRERVVGCHGMLRAICGRMQGLLLDHFEREHWLMTSLPPTPATISHCDRHRREHVNFSTQYNAAALRLQACEPAAGARELEEFVLGWVRSHALAYDQELSALLKA